MEKRSHVEANNHIHMACNYTNACIGALSHVHRTRGWVSAPTVPPLTELGWCASDERAKQLVVCCSVVSILTRRSTHQRATLLHKPGTGDGTRYQARDSLGAPGEEGCHVGWGAGVWRGGRGGDEGRGSATHRTHASYTLHTTDEPTIWKQSGTCSHTRVRVKRVSEVASSEVASRECQKSRRAKIIVRLLFVFVLLCKAS